MAPFRTRLRSSVVLAPMAALAVLGVFVAVTRLRGGVSPFSAVLVAAALFATFRLVGWLSSSAELESTGRLVVSGPWPGRRRSVELTGLSRVWARQQVTGTAGRDSGLRVQDTLELLDDTGATVSLRVREWARADLLIAAVEQAAARRGVPLTGGELFGLQTATPPPAAPVPLAPKRALPVLDLRLQNRLVHWLIGAVFTFLGTTALLFLGGIVALARGTPLGGLDSPFGLLPLLIATIFPCIGVAMLSLAFGASLRLGPDGVLRVRTSPPWRTRSVALGELTEISASHAGYVAVTGRPVRQKVALRLADRNGRTLTVDPGAWERPEAIAGALSAAAANGEVALDPGTARYLGGGVAPSPTGFRPTASG